MNHVTLKSLLTIFVVLSPAIVSSADLVSFIQSLSSETDPIFVQNYVAKADPEKMVEYMMSHTLPSQASMYTFLTQVASTFKSDLTESEYIGYIERGLQQNINELLKEVGYQEPLTSRLFYYQIDEYMKHGKFLSKELEMIMKQIDEMYGSALERSRPTHTLSEGSQN